MSSKLLFKLEKIADHHSVIAKAIGELADTVVLTGIPENRTMRKSGEPINNASLMYLHENGSDRSNNKTGGKGFPPRPAMKPGIERAKQKIVEHLRSAAKNALQGNVSGMNQEHNKAGQVAADSIRGVFVDNDWQQVTDATQKRKGPNKTRPLIDTGQLRKSITYVVEK